LRRGREGEGVAFVLEDGKRFKSPSSAGSAVMGGTACNGWRFWTVEGEAPAATEGDEQAPKATKPTRSRKLIYKLPNQKGVEEGKVKYFCDACQKAFLVEAGAEAPDNQHYRQIVRLADPPPTSYK
jgi:hypothetical protein